MSNIIRQRILSELRVALNEQEYSGVGFQKDRIAAGVKADPSIQRLVGGNGTPQDILAFVKSQANSNYINDDEAKLMKDSVVSATAKCSKQQLSQEELAWCQEYKTLAPQIYAINYKWNTFTGTQVGMRYEFSKAINQASKLSLSAGQASATPAGQLPTACPNNAQPIASNADGTQKCPDGTSIAAPVADAQPTTAPGTFDQKTRSFKCPDQTSIVNFQNWVKANSKNPQGKSIKADGAFGQKTFMAAKSLGNAVLNFSMYKSIDDFKDPAKLTQICTALAGDARFKTAAKPATPAAPAAAAKPVVAESIIKELNFLIKESKRTGLDKTDKPFYLNLLKLLSEQEKEYPLAIRPQEGGALAKRSDKRLAKKPVLTAEIVDDPEKAREAFGEIANRAVQSQQRGDDPNITNRLLDILSQMAGKQVTVQNINNINTEVQQNPQFNVNSSTLNQVKEIARGAGSKGGTSRLSKQQLMQQAQNMGLEINQDMSKKELMQLVNQNKASGGSSKSTATGGGGGSGTGGTATATTGAITINVPGQGTMKQCPNGTIVAMTEKCPGGDGGGGDEGGGDIGPMKTCPDGSVIPQSKKCSGGGGTEPPTPTPSPRIGKKGKFALAALAATAIGAGLFAKFKSSTPEIQDAVRKAAKNPCGLGDFIKAQLASRYIADEESEAMVSIARAYKQRCTQENNTCWCKKALECFPDYKQQINEKWSTMLDKQKSDKIEIINIFDEFAEMPKCMPVAEGTTCPDGTPAPDGDVTKCKKSPTPEPDGKTKCIKCNVRKGCKGQYVTELQQAIGKAIESGKVKVDNNKMLLDFQAETKANNYGEATEYFVRRFQASARTLVVDGIAGPKTFGKLGIKCPSGGGGGGKVMCPDKKTPAPGGDVSKCPPISAPTPDCPPYGKGSQKCPFTAEAYDFWYRNSSSSQKANKIVYFKRKPTDVEPEYQAFNDKAESSSIKDAVPTGAKECVDCSMSAMKNMGGTSSSLPYDQRILKNPDMQKESNNFGYENYYHSKKEKEANLLFEKLIKKL
jgi:hypothetical protein